ncbi:MAG: redoxin domain-containing protein [Planctomycetes bacterium]|nr:redoxin domain-containing protein [Planctomycetota bacterium]
MHEEYESQGLSIVALTNEGEDKTVPWIKSQGAEYAYAYDRGAKMQRALGVRGIPNAILVDATGKIIWQGFPTTLPVDVLKDALKGAISTPVYEWTGTAKGIKSSFLKGDYGKALKAADILAEKEDLGKEIGDLLRGIISTRIEKIESQLEAGDVFAAYSSAKAFAKKVKGLPEAAAVKAIVKSISGDKVLKKILSTQEKLSEIKATEHPKRKDCEKSIDKLEKLLKSNKDPYTEEQLRAQIKALKNMRRKLRS